MADKKVAPKKPRQKKINMKSIQAQEVEINKLYTHVLNEETNEVIKYYKIFDEAKIIALYDEALAKTKYASENDIEFFTDDSVFLQFISYLMIKYFTHLGDELKDSTLEDDIAAFGSLLSTGLFKTILNDVLDGNQVQRVYEMMTEHIEASARALEAETQIREATLAKTESPVIRDLIAEQASYRNVLNTDA